MGRAGRGVVSTERSVKSARPTFETIAARMIAEHEGVEPGRIRGRRALAYRGKVFAFPGRDREGDMVFRVGKAFDPDAAGLVGWSHPAPFKTRPPMRGWIRVPPDQADRWPEIAEVALADIRRELDGA
jgi:hypothetical protein